jgi:ubiquinone/menaquinone biosynthesis C-methylase UbiE
LITKALNIVSTTEVLDIGGSPAFWEDSPIRPRLVFVNLYRRPPWQLEPNQTYICADARQLPLRDGEADVVVSNSVIEHVGHWDDQRSFAREIRRVARRYAVQTPNAHFPIEPHFVAPCVHFLPRKWRPFIVRYLTPFGLIQGRRDPEYVRQLALEVRLLSPREIRELFPEATVWTERWLGLGKSLVAISP